jgi:outer membrane lipoprotein-sorting protein
MKNNKILLFPALLLIITILPAQDAKEIVRLSDAHSRGKSMKGEMVLKVVRPDYTRELDMYMWSKSTEYSLVEVLAPAKDKGTTYLKRKREVWDWVPTLERTIKLPPSMMSQSWMGTDFTNDDMVKEVSIVDDYDQTIMGEETIGGRICYKIQLIPKPTAAVVWSKLIMWIDKKDYLQLKTESYDDDGNLVNILTCSDIKMMGGRLLPTTIEVVPTDKPGHKTIIFYKSREYDMPMSDDFFSTQNMKNPKQ